MFPKIRGYTFTILFLILPRWLKAIKILFLSDIEMPEYQLKFLFVGCVWLSTIHIYFKQAWLHSNLDQCKIHLQRNFPAPQNQQNLITVVNCSFITTFSVDSTLKHFYNRLNRLIVGSQLCEHFIRIMSVLLLKHILNFERVLEK